MTALHWESTGTGDPVLMIMGLGLSGGAWWRTVPVLSRSLRVITFDNRGVGRSRARIPSYTTDNGMEASASYAPRIATSSTSKMSVAPGGITPPAPRSP